MSVYRMKMAEKALYEVSVFHFLHYNKDTESDEL